MIIETERIILREMTRDDFDALYRVLGDSDIMRHYPYTFDEKRVMNWINRNIERYGIFGFGLWALVLKETGGDGWRLRADDAEHKRHNKAGDRLPSAHRFSA